MSKENGGPAFPAPEAAKARFGSGNEDLFMGLDLRDYFAAKALSGIIANESMIQRHRDAAKENLIGEDVLLAASAYTLADAMIAERAK